MPKKMLYQVGMMWWFGRIPGRYTSRRIYLAHDVRPFHTMLIVWYGEPEPANSLFGYHAHRRLRSVRFAC